MRALTAYRIGCWPFVVIALCVLLVHPASTLAQTAPSSATKPAEVLLPPPRPVNPGPYQPPSLPGALPISLPVALRLALTSNLDIAQAREAIVQAEARLRRAEVMVIPNFNIGDAYNHHEGNIQKTEGNIEKVNRSSMFVGGGPSLSFSSSEALFGPIAARQLTAAAGAGFQRVNQDTLLAIADAYLTVLRARRRIARINETLEQLTSEQPSPLRGDSKGMLPLIQAFVESGAKEAIPAELERVRVEVLRRRDEMVGARDDLRLATAELARLLRLDPAAPLEPIEDYRVPVPVPVDGWPERPLAELVEAAVRNRPELAENRALVAAARTRVRTANIRPFLPNASLTFNWGDFGGGPDINPPRRGVTITTYGPGGELKHFNTRSDFDASLFWRLDNLGLGNRAEQREQRSLHRQAQLRELQVEDRVLTQVIQARELVQGWRERLDIAHAALFDAQGAPTGPVFKSMRLSFVRIRGGEGRPLELLDSIRGLSDLLEAYGEAMTNYERAELRLLYALGLPLQALWQHPVPDKAAASPRVATPGPGGEAKP